MKTRSKILIATTAAIITIMGISYSAQAFRNGENCSKQENCPYSDAKTNQHK